MDDFYGYLRSRAISALETLDAAHRNDTYVVSFYVNDENGDPLRPTLKVGTNTETQVTDSLGLPSGPARPSWWTPSTESEERWNYAHWLQDNLVEIGSYDDHTGVQLRSAWLEAEGLLPHDDDSFDDEADDEDVTAAFVDLCVRVVHDMHRSGVTEQIFGRAIPIIIHELEYYEQIAAQNRDANGPHLAAGLIEWIRTG